MSWFSIKDLNRIEIEITSFCNARCPFCPRQIHSTYEEDPEIPKKHLRVDQLLSLLPSLSHCEDVNVDFIGAFGDPIMHPDLVELCDKFLEHKNIKLSLETNGGVRELSLWEKLGSFSQDTGRFMIRFSIDGLEDTNSIYRGNTDFKKIMERAQAFINSGGRAEWKFISFEHNQHQIEEAKALAKSMGFTRFILHDTPRWKKMEHPIKGTNYIIRPSDASLRNKKNMISMCTDSKVEKCKSLTQVSLFLNYRFELWPCSFFSVEREKYKERWNPYWEGIVGMYGEDFNNLDNITLDKILEHPYFKSTISQSWESGKNYNTSCGRFCGNVIYWNPAKTPYQLNEVKA